MKQILDDVATMPSSPAPAPAMKFVVSPALILYNSPFAAA
jgi:hypothetical protein